MTSRLVAIARSRSGVCPTQATNKTDTNDQATLSRRCPESPHYNRTSKELNDPTALHSSPTFRERVRGAIHISHPLNCAGVLQVGVSRAGRCCTTTCARRASAWKSRHGLKEINLALSHARAVSFSCRKSYVAAMATTAAATSPETRGPEEQRLRWRRPIRLRR